MLARITVPDAVLNYLGRRVLSRSDHKFHPKSGMASFWNHTEGSVKVRDTEIRNEDLENENVSLFEFKEPSTEPKGAHCEGVGLGLPV